MKDFNIAKYLRENHLGSHAILGAYVDLHNLKEEEEVELDTEIPYEGPEHKLDGFGDEFVQANPVEEVNSNHKFKVVIPSAGVTRNQLQFMNDNDIDVTDVGDKDDWDDQRNQFTAPNEEVLKLMIAKFYPKRLGLGKKEVLDLINTIEPITSPVEELEKPEKIYSNDWMNNSIDDKRVGNWTCYYEDQMGTIYWIHDNIPVEHIMVYATPNWDGAKGIAIEVQQEYGEQSVDHEVVGDPSYPDFESYAEDILPVLKKIEDKYKAGEYGKYDQGSNDSMDTDDSVNPFPSIMKEKEDNGMTEDSGISDDRFAAAGGDSIKFAIKSLMGIGVDGKKIAQFVVDTIRAFQK